MKEIYFDHRKNRTFQKYYTWYSTGVKFIKLQGQKTNSQQKY